MQLPRFRFLLSILVFASLAFLLSRLLEDPFERPDAGAAVSAQPSPKESSNARATQRSHPAPGLLSDPEPEQVPGLSPDMARLVEGIHAGRAVELRVGDETMQYLFRPRLVTTDNFRVSAGPDNEFPAAFEVFEGRRILDDGSLTGRATLAVVNDAVSMAYSTEQGDYLVERDESGQLVARTLLSREGDSAWGHWACGNSEFSCSENAGACSHTHTDSNTPQLVGIREQSGDSPEPPLEDVTITLASEASNEPNLAGARADHPYFRLGSEYDASLKDIVILMVSSKSQTGTSSNLSSRAASYFSYAATLADVYERQLGMRVRLQEMILIPSDSSAPDIESPDIAFQSGTEQLFYLRDWAATHRPQATYQWGHVMGWTLVDGVARGTVGWAWPESYGSSSSGTSVNERAWTWGVIAHELGHNVGADHTNGGVMNSSVSQSNPQEDFFKENNTSGGGFTAAKQIYDYMTSPGVNYFTGPAPLRHPNEQPFGVDDVVSTAADTPVNFNPLTNDLTATPLSGLTNTVLSLVEVGQVFPKAAGTVLISGNQITFIPASGFTGQAWFSYTLRGDVGNGGLGWMHAADVVVTVGGNNTPPSQNPALSTTQDTLRVDFTGPIRLNPLLNDEATGRLWAGDVDALNFGSGAVVTSDAAFELIGASVVSGNGTIALETARVTRAGVSALQNTGYLVYTPGVNEPGQIVLSYTVQDASGIQSTGTIVLNDASIIAPPEGLVAAQGGSMVELDWDDSLDPNFDSYRVYRSESPGVFGAPLEVDLPSSGFSDDTVVDGATYYYVVTVVDNLSQESVFSAPAVITFEENLFAPLVDAGGDQSVVLTGGAAWTPDLAGPAAWYDASFADSLTLNGSSVTVWADRSSNGLDLTSTSGREPTTGSVTINGLNALDFTNDEMVTASNPFGASVSDAFVIAVHRVDNDANKGTLFTLTGSGTAANRWQSHAPFGGTVYFDTGGAGGANRVKLDYGTNTGDFVLLGLYGSVTDSVQQIYKNGQLLNDDTTGHVVSTVGNISIGSAIGGSYQDTSIGEFIIINGTVSTEVRQNLEGYLAHKWGLDGNLPEGHPYKLVAPGASGVVVSIEGAVSDLDGNSPSTVWSQVSGPGSVIFADASALATTVTILEAGTYVLRLTADDGVYQTNDEITIVVRTDEDGDGMDDAWESTFFPGQELTIDGTADSDGDGVLDFFEYLYGSDPTDAAASGFRLSAGQDGGNVTFIWEVFEGFVLGSDYLIEISTDLSDPEAWIPLPPEHFSVPGNPPVEGGRSQIDLEITHDYGDHVFIRLVQP